MLQGLKNVGDLMDALKGQPRDAPIAAIVGAGRRYTTTGVSLQVAQRHKGSNVIVGDDESDDTETVIGLVW